MRLRTTVLETLRHSGKPSELRKASLTNWCSLGTWFGQCESMDQ
jgi:hypothetical protein